MPTDPTILQYYNLTVKFLSVDYLDILLAYSYNIIYRLVIDKHPDVGEDSGYWKRIDHVGEFHSFRRHGQALIWIERVRSIALSGADQVLALTEDSINRILHSRWTALGSSHLLSTWSKDSFRANFNPLTVRMLSNGKVIVYVDIEHGESGSRV